MMSPAKDRMRNNISNRSIGRVQGASFPSETCVRTSL